MGEEKKCLNPLCGKKFTPLNPKGKYCSPNCKAAHQYQQKKLAKGNVVVKGKKIEVPEKVAKALIASPFYKKDGLDYSDLGKRFIEICKMKKVNAEDMLVWVEENYGKKQSFPSNNRFGKKKKEETPSRVGESYIEKRLRMKNSGSAKE